LRATFPASEVRGTSVAVWLSDRRRLIHRRRRPKTYTRNHDLLGRFEYAYP
jgi:hypothetical protein